MFFRINFVNSYTLVQYFLYCLLKRNAVFKIKFLACRFVNDFHTFSFVKCDFFAVSPRVRWKRAVCVYCFVCSNAPHTAPRTLCSLRENFKSAYVKEPKILRLFRLSLSSAKRGTLIDTRLLLLLAPLAALCGALAYDVIC
jgi:hypothetical protein